MPVLDNSVNFYFSHHCCLLFALAVVFRGVRIFVFSLGAGQAGYLTGFSIALVALVYWSIWALHTLSRAARKAELSLGTHYVIQSLKQRKRTIRGLILLERTYVLAMPFTGLIGIALGTYPWN